MEQENKQDQFEINFDDNSNVIEINEGKRHHSHHHSSHSHHSSHNTHKKRRSSRNKKSKESLSKRIRTFFKTKSKRKTNFLSILLLFVIMALLVVLMYYINVELKNADSYDGYQDGAFENGDHSQSQINQNTSSSQSLEVPKYWDKMIEEKTKTVQALHIAGGKDCVSFAWASDTHIPDNHTARTDELGKVMAKMMDNCNIPFAVLTGDIGTRASKETEEELDKVHNMISTHLAPLWNTDRLLVALGNHDGCYGKEDTELKFKSHLTPEKLWDWYFRGQSLDSRRVFSEDGSYFYVDIQSQKIRYIVLNSQFGGEYLINSSGAVVNDNFEISCYGQKQLDWLSDVALDMPEGYGAVIAAHVPPRVLYDTHTEPYTVDCDQVCGIINAYNNKTTFTGSYTEGVDGWSNSVVDVDFTTAKGEIIAMFTGHVHHDSIDTTTLECPLITIISAGASVNWGEEPERTFNTDTETSFDIVTINRKTRTIYCTRVGAGEDRKIEY